MPKFVVQFTLIEDREITVEANSTVSACGMVMDSQFNFEDTVVAKNNNNKVIYSATVVEMLEE